MVDVPEAEAVENYEGFSLVLLRPDQHVAWRSSSDPTAADADYVLDVVTGGAILAPTADVFLAERSEPSDRAAATLDALARPARAAVSADGPMHFAIHAETEAAAAVIRQAVLADGSIGPARPFATVRATALTAYSTGGVWACVASDGSLLISASGSFWRVALSD